MVTSTPVKKINRKCAFKDVAFSVYFFVRLIIGLHIIHYRFYFVFAILSDIAAI